MLDHFNYSTNNFIYINLYINFDNVQIKVARYGILFIFYVHNF